MDNVDHPSYHFLRYFEILFSLKRCPSQDLSDNEWFVGRGGGS